MSRFGVVIFPGSNCDLDAYHALKDTLGVDTEYIWHQESNLSGFDGIVLPGGFSYGDYLRCGAIARFSPVMKAVTEFAASGGLVIGICNGFQILCEAGLLPGALVRNEGLKFVCKQVHIRVENAETPFTSLCKKGQVLQIPIAHGEGRYVCDESTLAELKASNRIMFRYSSPEGEQSPEWNPNGAMDDIAGVANERFNVLGMMPHPERASDLLLGSADGRLILDSFVRCLSPAH
ncbi:MAG: phosphoribosylformylglycinamidine synthase subunit PurQ [bacterium]